CCGQPPTRTRRARHPWSDPRHRGPDDGQQQDRTDGVGRLPRTPRHGGRGRTGPHRSVRGPGHPTGRPPATHAPVWARRPTSLLARVALPARHPGRGRRGPCRPADHGTLRGLSRNHPQALAMREYPYEERAGQILGYLQPVTQEELESREELRTQLTGVDQVGRDGLEAVYDKELRGTSGLSTFGVNNHGEVMDVISETLPEPGAHLITHLDMNVQKVAEDALARGMENARSKYEADSGAAVVLDVRTGGVVAMASVPTYDPTIWEGGIDQETFDEILSEEAGEPM